MYRVDRNNFYGEAKNATVYTPKGVSEFIFSLVAPTIKKGGTVIDPCVGEGALLEPFKRKGFQVVGIDIQDQGFPDTRVQDFMEAKASQFPKPDLVIANPPFNLEQRTKELIADRFGRRPLLPEVWLRHCVELWGKEVPLVLFAPYGLRLNQSLTSARWQRFVNRDYPEIASIIALPKDIYEDVLFHSEILIFNVKGLKAHYFYDG
ncbi:MAG: SAM-dependent methyltransferase [Pseudomonadota bacterium]